MKHRLDAIGAAAARPHPTMAPRRPGQGAGDWLRGAGMVLACALCAFAQQPGTPNLGATNLGTPGFDRIVACDAADHLDSKDPVVRGEAALVVAQSGGRDQEAKLLALAADPAVETRRRATIALGLLATPNAVRELEQRLATTDGRQGEDGAAAAFALGIVPPEAAGTAVARTLTLFRRGSWKRQHDVLIALLLGMLRHPERTAEQTALRELYDNEANRAPEVRALLLQLLLPGEATLDDKELGHVLERGSDPEQLAALRWMAERPPTDNGPWLEQLLRTASRDDRPEHRTAALLALGRSHHVPTLGVAARALTTGTPAECAQAMQAMTTIGGASARGPIEQHVLDERDPARKAALLNAYSAPLSDRLADHLVALQLDRRQPIETRVAAAALLAQSRPERAAPMLRDLFRVAETEAELLALARAIRAVEKAPIALDKLFRDPSELGEKPLRWQALLAAGHGEAQRQLLAALTSAAPVETTRTALRAWRKVAVLAVPGDAPQSLRALD